MRWRDKIKAVIELIEERMKDNRSAYIHTELYSDLYLVLTSSEILPIYQKYNISVHSNGKGVDVIIKRKDHL
jgi:hypothetical protein